MLSNSIRNACLAGAVLVPFLSAPACAADRFIVMTFEDIDGIGTGAVPPTETMGLYRIELPDDMTIACTRPGERPPGARNCETGRMMNGDLSRGYSYRAIGPVRAPKG